MFKSTFNINFKCTLCAMRMLAHAVNQSNVLQPDDKCCYVTNQLIGVDLLGNFYDCHVQVLNQM